MTAISLFLPEYLPMKIQEENGKRNLLPRRHWLIMCTRVILSHSCAHRHAHTALHGILACTAVWQNDPRAHHKAHQRRGIRVSETFAESWSSGAARADHREWSVFPWKGMSRSDRGWEIEDSLRPYEKREPASVLFLMCPIVTNYRTFIDDLYKVLEFVEWYKEWYW